MTRPAAPRASADLKAFYDLMSEIKREVTAVRDEQTAGKIRQDEHFTRIARLDAKLESLATDMADMEQRATSTRSETLRTVTNSYRKLSDEITEIRGDVGKLKDEAKEGAQGVAVAATAQVKATVLEQSDKTQRMVGRGIGAGVGGVIIAAIWGIVDHWSGIWKTVVWAAGIITHSQQGPET